MFNSSWQKKNSIKMSFFGARSNRCPSRFESRQGQEFHSVLRSPRSMGNDQWRYYKQAWNCFSNEKSSKGVLFTRIVIGVIIKKIYRYAHCTARFEKPMGIRKISWTPCWQNSILVVLTLLCEHPIVETTY